MNTQHTRVAVSALIIVAAPLTLGTAQGIAQSTAQGIAQGTAQGVAQGTYTIKPLPPGGPTPRLADGHPDFTGQWFPNGAGQGVSGRYGVDPAAIPQFDRKATPEEPPQFRPEALAKIKSMTATELELSKSSVNCMPRGVPAIWLQNPYTTFIVHKPGLLAQLYEVLNNWRLIHTDGRPLPKNPEPFFHGNSTTHWEGDTLVVESTGFRDDGWLDVYGSPLTEQGKLIERWRRPDYGHLEIDVTIDDPKAYTKPWDQTIIWRLEPDTDLIESICEENNRDLPHMVGK